jgi:acyl-CoA thioesterase FadM
MADSDAGGVIYYGAPYPWHEAALLGWLAEIGRPISAILRSGNAFPCVHSEADYRRPLRVDDVVDVRLHTLAVGSSSFQLQTEVWLQELSVVVRAVYVWSTGDPREGMKSTPLPPWLRSALESPLS